MTLLNKLPLAAQPHVPSPTCFSSPLQTITSPLNLASTHTIMPIPYETSHPPFSSQKPIAHSTLLHFSYKRPTFNSQKDFWHPKTPWQNHPHCFTSPHNHHHPKTTPIKDKTRGVNETLIFANYLRSIRKKLEFSSVILEPSSSSSSLIHRAS